MGVAATTAAGEAAACADGGDAGGVPAPDDARVGSSDPAADARWLPD